MSDELKNAESAAVDETGSHPDAKWYVVHTYSGYENKVKEDLEKSVENMGLQHLIPEVKYPTEEVLEFDKNG